MKTPLPPMARMGISIADVRDDPRTEAEFLSELASVPSLSLDAQLAFLRCRSNRDRARGIPACRLTELLRPAKRRG